MSEDFPIRVLVANDLDVTLLGIITWFKNSRFCVVGKAKDGPELIDQHNKLQPDLILTELFMPGVSGLDAIREIKAKDKNVKVLFFSEYSGVRAFIRCKDAGGLGLVGLEATKDELQYAMHVVYKGNHYFRKELSPEELNKLIDENIEKAPDPPLNLHLLTQKELQLFEYIGKGFSSAEIAERLKISSRTVFSHQKIIMEKLGIKHVPQLIRRGAIHLWETKRR